MYKDSKRTCTAIILLIKPFVWWHSSPSWFAKAPSTLIRFQTKTEPFENALQSGATWKRCFLKTPFSSVDGENGDVIKTTRPWVSKMADRRHHVASISRPFRRPIYWNAHASSSFDHAHWGYNSVFKQIRRCSVDGRKRYENDKCGRKSFWKRISVDRA